MRSTPPGISLMMSQTVAEGKLQVWQQAVIIFAGDLSTEKSCIYGNTKHLEYCPDYFTSKACGM